MVKILFDTSVLVAALWVNHPQHTVCLHWLQRARLEQIKGLIATHNLAEAYSVLTRLPIAPRIAPQVAKRLIAENLDRFETIPLNIEDYQMVIDQMVSLNLTGGSIYDALIARVAIKAEVDNLLNLLTLNPNHFVRLGEDIANLVLVPQ